MKTTETKNYKIDADGKILGRVASEAAKALRGKNQATFARHLLPGIKVEITNVGKLKMSANKSLKTIYTSYTGYPGGLRQITRAAALVKHGPTWLLKKAIYGMLPDNRLRAPLMKQLIITE